MQIPNYDLKEVIGQGGMATVYRAEHKLLKQQRAIKVILGDLSREMGFEASFLREGQLIASLRHPHVITVYDVGLAESGYFMAMEYLQGGSLKERLNRGALSLVKTLSVLDQIGAALHYAHSKGLIHRDIKPANILFRDTDEAVLTDFGISKIQDTESDLTRHGYALMGTPRYMSPEQTGSQALDARSDLYSLALVFYEMLVGQPAIKADTTAMIIREHLLAAPPLLPATYSHLQPVLDKALAKQPEQRYGSVKDFLQALHQAEQAQQIEATLVLPQVTPTVKATNHNAEFANPSAKSKVHQWGYIILSIVVLGVAVVLVTWSLMQTPLTLPKTNVSTAPTATQSQDVSNNTPVSSKLTNDKTLTSEVPSKIHSDLEPPAARQPATPIAQQVNRISEPVARDNLPQAASGGAQTTNYAGISVPIQTYSSAKDNQVNESPKNTNPVAENPPYSTIDKRASSPLAADQTELATLTGRSQADEVAAIMLAGKKPYIILYNKTASDRMTVGLIPADAEIKVFNTVLDDSGVEWRRAEFEGKVGFVKAAQLKPK